MREVTLKYEFGTGFDYEVEPTTQNIYDFLEYYSDYSIKKDGLDFLTSILKIDLEEVVFDYNDTIFSDFKYWLKDEYEGKAYEEYQDYKKEKWQMKSRNYY